MIVDKGSLVENQHHVSVHQAKSDTAIFCIDNPAGAGHEGIFLAE